MTLRGTYAQLVRRVEEAERWVEVLAPINTGCPTCAAWPDHVTCYPDPPQYPHVDGTPWYCRAWARPHGDDCAGSRECHPRRLWPASFRCPDCAREPVTVINVVYGDWPPGHDGRWTDVDDGAGQDEAD